MTIKPLTNSDIALTAPSVFATKPWEGVSSRYCFIPTINVIDALRDTGFMPVRASQSHVRTSSKKPFTKHMIRFRSKEDIAPPRAGVKRTVGDELVEIVLLNAHDRSSAYSLDAGVFRLVCENGLVMKSADFGSINVRHSGNIIQQVLSGTKDIIERAPIIKTRVKAWRAINLTDVQRLTLAQAALIQRYGLDKANNIMSPITPESLLIPRRPEDAGRSLWVTTNVIQENIMRGQIEGRAASGRRTSTRAITSVNAEMELNRGIWAMAEVIADSMKEKE